MRLQNAFPPIGSPQFIEARFKARAASRPEPGLGAAIVELAGNLPYDVQRLAHEVVGRCAERAAEGAPVSTSCTRRCGGCSASTTTLFESMWQRLTLAQRGALRAAVLEDGRELLVAPTCARAIA